MNERVNATNADSTLEENLVYTTDRTPERNNINRSEYSKPPDSPGSPSKLPPYHL